MRQKIYISVILIISICFLVCKKCFSYNSDDFNLIEYMEASNYYSQIREDVWYSDRYIPFGILRKNLGNILMNVESMDSLFGSPCMADHELIRYGRSSVFPPTTFYDLEDYAEDLLLHIPKCRLHTYYWEIDSTRLLRVNYIEYKENLIPIDGLMFDKDEIVNMQE